MKRSYKSTCQHSDRWRNENKIGSIRTRIPVAPRRTKFAIRIRFIKEGHLHRRFTLKLRLLCPIGFLAIHVNSFEFIRVTCSTLSWDESGNKRTKNDEKLHCSSVSSLGNKNDVHTQNWMLHKCQPRDLPTNRSGRTHIYASRVPFVAGYVTDELLLYAADFFITIALFSANEQNYLKRIL